MIKIDSRRLFPGSDCLLRGFLMKPIMMMMMSRRRIDYPRSSSLLPSQSTSPISKMTIMVTTIILGKTKVAIIILETTVVASSVMSSAMMMMVMMMIALQHLPQASLQDNCFLFHIYYTNWDIFSHTLVIMRTIIVITVTTITRSS